PRPRGRRTDAPRGARASAERSGRCRGRWCGPVARRRPATASREGSRGLVGVGVLGAVLVVVAARVDRDQLVHRVEIVDEELAVQVVELMLEGPAEEAAA